MEAGIEGNALCSWQVSRVVVCESSQRSEMRGKIRLLYVNQALAISYYRYSKIVI